MRERYRPESTSPITGQYDTSEVAISSIADNCAKHPLAPVLEPGKFLSGV